MDSILTENRPKCIICGTTGILLYQRMRDRRFAVPEEFSIKSCPDCGLCWLDPLPKAEELHKCYAQYYSAERFPATTHSPEGIKTVVREFLCRNYLCRQYGYRHLHRRHFFCRISGVFAYVPFLRPVLTYHWGIIFPHFQRGPGNLLVDVGCGSGEFLALMKRLGWDVLGIEPDPAGARLVRDKGVEVFEGTLEDAGVKEASCYQVSLRHSIEHLYDPRKTLAECARIIKPGGRLVLVTPNAASLCHREFKDHCYHLDPPRHLFSFSVEAIRRLVENAGFRIVTMRTLPATASSIYNYSRMIAEYGTIGACAHAQPHKGSHLFALKEWVMCRAGYACGEEIAVEAVK